MYTCGMLAMIRVQSPTTSSRPVRVVLVIHCPSGAQVDPQASGSKRLTAST